MGLKHLLDVAIEDGFNGLDKMEVGSEEYIKTGKLLNEMSAQRIDIEKVEVEEADREAEKALKSKEMKLELIDRYVKHGLTAVSIIGGFALTVWGAKASWKFEETGTVTSTAGRKFISNLFFKK